MCPHTVPGVGRDEGASIGSCWSPGAKGHRWWGREARKPALHCPETRPSGSAGPCSRESGWSPAWPLPAPGGDSPGSWLTAGSLGSACPRLLSPSRRDTRRTAVPLDPTNGLILPRVSLQIRPRAQVLGGRSQPYFLRENNSSYSRSLRTVTTAKQRSHPGGWMKSWLRV